MDATMPLGTDPDATIASAPAAPPLTPHGQTSVTGARFIPGEIVKERYRIVGLLGRGGMGEVYRAEDLKLGQQVALKFLPPGLERDGSRLQMFLNEVRTARQVTHPNVCRVYDVDEVDGQHFLSMEYVDGEDLATSLRRIGRLPEETAVPVARQICAGLAAAHEQGILHRDLKPANVMLDGRGRVKLTDFGLAGLAETLAEGDVTAGTPAYMSPEQITGRDVSVRSDIYALGLVLYELFTGQAAFRAKDMAEFRALHTDTMPSQMTTHVPGLDPVVERAIMRCLSKDPEERPTGALAVAAALPGGDPLQAALAAGETPSPELVAEAGRRDGMPLGRVLLLAVVAAALLVVGTHWGGRSSYLGHLDLEKRPEVLIDQARGMLRDFGYDEPVYDDPIDTAWGIIVWGDVVREVGAADSSATRWDALRERPDAGGLWYRQAPDVLRPNPFQGPILLRGDANLVNPPPSMPGEVSMVLDLAGRLRRLEVTPRRFSAPETPAEPDWTLLFAAAGLDTARFASTMPRYQRTMTPDIRRAWLGTRADRPDVLLRVEAGSFEGRPNLFNVATEAGLQSLGAEPQRRAWTPVNYLQNLVQPLVILAIIITAVRSRRSHDKGGRSDRIGSMRFASVVMVLFLVGEGLQSHSFFSRAWAEEFWPLLGGAIFTGVMAWTLYGAAEPLGRRIWPTMFVSSSRLLSQTRVPRRDPLIGYSILVGMIAAGALFIIIGPLHWGPLMTWRGLPPDISSVNLDLFTGHRQALGLVLNQALYLGFLFLHIMALVMIRYLVKLRAVAILLTLAVWTMLAGSSSSGAVFNDVLTAGVSLFILLRFGVVAFIACRVGLYLSWNARFVDLESWFSQGPVLVLGALLAVVLYGAWAAVGERTSRPPEA